MYVANVANSLINETLISVQGLQCLMEKCLVNCLHHFRSEITIKMLYIVNWQVLSQVVMGEKQPYKMNNMTKVNIILKFTSFFL